MTDSIGAFEQSTSIRLATEAARYVMLEHYLRTGELPETTTYFAYSTSFDWGNPPGHFNDGQPRPLRGKRVRITFEVEDH